MSEAAIKLAIEKIFMALPDAKQRKITGDLNTVMGRVHTSKATNRDIEEGETATSALNILMGWRD